MTNFNFLSNPVAENEVNRDLAAEENEVNRALAAEKNEVNRDLATAENEVNRALAAAKTLQNAGGGTSRHKALIIAKQFSQYCISRSEGAHTSEQFPRYCVSQSEGTQVTSARSAVDVTVSSYGAPDEHPMSIRSASDGERWQNRGWKYVAMIFAVLVMSVANVGMAWGTEATISATQSNDYSSSCYLIPDGTAISAIAGAGGNGFGNESGPKAKITVNAAKKTATLTFTIKSGITITSFKVNGESNNNVTYDLDGTAVTIGTALTGLSKTSSMVFTLTCTETSGSSARNTKISSIVLTYTSDAGGGGGGGSGTGTGTISWAITTNALTLTPTISGAGSSNLSGASTTLSLTGLTTTSSSKDGYCLPFYGTVADCPDNDDYVSVAFTVASGYTFTPSSLSLTCFSHGSGDFKYKAVISDATYKITSNELQPSSGGEGVITFASGAFTNKALTGTVTIKIFIYGLANSATGKRSYIKSPIEITGTVATAASCTAPSSVSVGDQWLAFVGEPLTLTASLTGGSGDHTYQWYKGGTSDGYAIEGATSATYYKAEAEAGDADNYYCKVSTEGDDDVWSDAYKVQVLRLQLMWSDGTPVSDYTFHNFKSLGGNKATVSIPLEAYNYSYYIIDGFKACGNNGTIQRSNYTGTPWIHNVSNQRTGLNCDKAGTYIFTIDYSNYSSWQVSVGFPEDYYYKGNEDGWSSTHAMDVSCDGSYAYYWAKGKNSLNALDKGNNNNFLIVNSAGTSTLADGNKLEIRNGESSGFGGTDIWGTGHMGKWDGTSDNASIYNVNDFYIIVFFPKTYVNTTSSPKICASTKLPDTGTTADELVYFDNSESWSNVYYRIGHKGYNDAEAMTAVPGTARLYKMTTVAWAGYEAWNIANNKGNYGSHSIYDITTNTITGATNYFKCEDDGNITILLDGVHNTESGCTYYDVTASQGLLTHTATISATTNGSIRLNWTDVSGTAQNATATTAGLAHTCNLQVTAVPATGYEITTLTVNGENFTSGTTHVLSADATIAATFSPASYTVTLNTNDGTINAGNVTSYTYGTGATLPTNVTKDGFTFGGWYDNEGLTGSAVTTISTTATGNKTYWAKWTAAASLTAISADVLYQAADMANITFTESDQNFTGLSTNNLFKVYGTDGNAAKGKTVSSTSITDDIGSKSFTSLAYIMQADNLSSESDPTKGAIEIITPSTAGLLYVYTNNTSTNLKLKKKGQNSTTALSGAKYKAVEVEANTHYFIVNDGGNSNREIYGIQYVSTYGVTITPTNVTKATGDATAIKGKAYTATFTADDGYTLPSDVTVTIGGASCTKGTEYTWSVSDDTGTLTVNAANVTGNIVVNVTGAAAATYALTYNCNGAESGCPSSTTASALPDPLPSAPTRDGYTFGGWYTDEGLTVAAVAGATMKGATTLYAKWTVNSSSECITITNFATSNVNNTCGDGNGKIFYGYKGSVSDANALTITSNDGNDHGQNSGAEMRLTYNKLMRIYANNTTNAAPATFSNVTSVSFKWKFIASGNSGNTELTSSYTVKVGSTTIANAVSITGKTKDGYQTVTIDNLAQLSGYVEIKFSGSSSSYNVYLDDIEICTASMSSCTAPTLPTATLNDQTVCPGNDIAEWDATPTNASTITAAGQSISYSWKKKGNATELANEESFDLGASAAESQAGTYVVTVTVSKAGYASATATKEVTLTVNEATEVTGITADKATVYPGNSVTLTATANITPDPWQWYTCTNAEGEGEVIISGATSASYTITSAGAAGTYYYKAKATGDCGTAERVYTLVVTAASECEKYFWFVYAADATSNGVINNRDNFFGSSPKTGSSNSSTYKFTLDGTEYTATRNTGDNTFSISFTVPEGSTATLALNCKGSSSKPIYLIPTSGDPVLITDNSSNAAHVVENIAAGTYKVGAKTDASASWTLAGMAVQVCTASTCTDATPTITAANTTVCVGSELSISSTGYEAGATFQWQKLNNSTSTWDNISGATSATYTVTTAAAEHAGSYRLVATKGCARTSNTVTISVPSAPNFGSTVPASVSVMQTIALSINTVEATDATKYKWYKSADATWDAGDTEIGTNKELIKAYDGEAIGSSSYYIFCRAQNACGITTSTAIAVNVTAYVEEDCATRGNESDAEFGFEYSAGQATYNSTACWSMNDNSKKLIYAAPDGKYFKTMKVTIASSSADKASYRWSTNGGTSYTEVAINSINTTLTEKTIEVSDHGNVNALQIGRNLDGKGESSGTLYVSKICFEYTDACTATTVTPSPTSKTYEMDGSSFTEPTFTVKHGEMAFDPQPTLSYSSSNEDIASVDDDGTVTFNGEAGTVTITAAYAGNATYCASEGSYTITVNCPGGAPKVVAIGGTTVGCNSSITLQAKQSDETSDFADGTYQWFRNGTEIDGATNSSYTATQAGTYTVARTSASDCTTPSTNSAVVTSTATEPEVERLVPFQYYHVDKTYSDQMKMRHLFAVKNSGTKDGKHFKLYVSRNGVAATDVTSSNALVVVPNGDGHVDTVMVDLNKLSGKYSENDELVFTCKAIDCDGNVSDVYKNTITMNVIGATPTLALICSGSNKASGTRKTSELTVGGDFLTGYNKADLCQQTGGTSFNANTEWGLYTDLKANYIVTPVNGYAVFNKLNYEPFDILLLTDYPKASKSDAAKDVLDDMAALCDYRPMLSFKTHMVAKKPSKWAAKGFTTSATENKADGRLNLNIVCYAHPMFEHLKSGTNVYRDADNSSELVYTMLSGTGYEGSKGMQGFEIDAAENFVTIGLTHYNASAAPNTPSTGNLKWTPDTGDRMLVTVAERQTNIEARFILFSINCGAQSKLTPKGEEVILACLEYLLETDPLKVADCSFTFDNGAGAPQDKEWYKDPANCPGCTGELGDGKWSTQANWGPDRINLPGEFTSARIAAPVTVDMDHAKAMELRIIDEGSIDIPAGKALDVKSTIRRMEGSEIYPTDVNDIHIGSGASGNGTLIFNNNTGDTKAQVDMYSNAKADVANMSATTSTWQYIGTPHNDIGNAQRNYYDSWLYQYSGSGWEVIPNGGPLVPFRGYCITHPVSPNVYEMTGTLAATTTQDIAVPAGYTVIANSWVAPIDINTITDDDMEGISDKTIYFFNTGTDAEGDNATGTAAGTYRATPIHSASYTGDWQIPSMQGFYVSTTSAGTFHLDYERHVRPAGGRTIVSNPMYAPRRAKAAEEEPAVLKIFARGSRYQDKLVVLEREDFTRGYDSGWDGEAWGGSDLSPMVYVTGEGREDAVSAIPEFEGTVVAFKAGEDSEYRFEFVYSEDAEPLYLFDTENNTYTQIMTGNAYYFTTSDKAPHSRFILTRKAPQIVTGAELTSDGEGANAKKLLIEDKMYILLNGVLYDATGKIVVR